MRSVGCTIRLAPHGRRGTLRSWRSRHQNCWSKRTKRSCLAKRSKAHCDAADYTAALRAPLWSSVILCHALAECYDGWVCFRIFAVWAAPGLFQVSSLEECVGILSDELRRADDAYHQLHDVCNDQHRQLQANRHNTNAIRYGVHSNTPRVLRVYPLTRVCTRAQIAFRVCLRLTACPSLWLTAPEHPLLPSPLRASALWSLWPVFAALARRRAHRIREVFRSPRPNVR